MYDEALYRSLNIKAKMLSTSWLAACDYYEPWILTASARMNMVVAVANIHLCNLERP